MKALSLLSLAPLVRLQTALAAFGSQNGRVFVSTPASKSPNKFVADCMSPVQHVLTADMSIDETIALLLRDDMTGAPVVDNDKRVIGIVTSFDFLQKEAFQGVLLPMEGTAANVEKCVDAAKKICGQKVSDIMSTNVATVYAATPMRQAAGLMTEKKLHRLPVLDDTTKELIGVLTTENVMHHLLQTVQNLPAIKDDIVSDLKP